MARWVIFHWNLNSIILSNSIYNSRMYGATDFRRQEFPWVRLEEDFKVRRYQLAYEYMQFIKMINSSDAVRGYFSFAWAPSEKIIMNLFQIFSIDFKIFFPINELRGYCTLSSLNENEEIQLDFSFVRKFYEIFHSQVLTLRSSSLEILN